MRGMDLDVVCGRDTRNSELHAARFVDTAITTSCLYLPLRCCILWTVQAAGMLSIVRGVILCGSPYPDEVGGVIVMMSVLETFAFMGAYRHEG